MAMMIRSLPDEALLPLEGRRAILSTAREVTKVLAASGFDWVVVGGVATVLHGHIRSTSNVNVFLAEWGERVIVPSAGQNRPSPVFGALDAMTGEATTLIAQRERSAGFLQFLR